MKVLLYIGHHKVGSTSLQAFLSRNWLALARSGILYPAVDSEGVSEQLQRCLKGADPEEVPKINVREPHNALAFRMLSRLPGKKMPPYHQGLPLESQMFKTLKAQIRQIQPQTVVICSEVMSNFGHANPDLIDRLKAQLPDEAEVELYCVLRRPDEYLASWQGQLLKFGRKVVPLSDGGALKFRNSIHFDYRTLLEPWVQRFPEARLHIRPYREILTAGGSVKDFISRVGSDFPSGLPQPPRRNPSLPYATYEIMREGNHALDRRDAHALRALLLAVRGDSGLPANEEVELFGSETREKLAETFTPIADYLAQFAPGGTFFTDLKEMTRCHPRTEHAVLPEALATVAARESMDDTPPVPGPVRQFLKKLRAERLHL